MKITINDKYHIAVDTYNHTLIETYKSKKNDSEEMVERTRPLGYFPSIEKALVFLARYEVVQSEETLSLKEYLNKLRDTQNELIRAVKGEME